MGEFVPQPGHADGQECPPPSSVAVITGGQGGLARGMEAALVNAGVKVSAPGRDKLDVSCADSVVRFFAGVGDVDLLVCNAGITMDRPLARMMEADWDPVMQVNLRGAFLCAREASRRMVKRRAGHILFISSFSAAHPPAGQANYAAAKAALIGMVKSLARELGPRNVRVNVVLPGFLDTRMTAALPQAAKRLALEKHTLNRLNTVEAAADFIVFLHRQMPHTSGQVFNLDSRVL